MTSGAAGDVGHHPRRDGKAWSGRILYPVLSRRVGGMSLGVNLFPDGKRCDFDCVYCEVDAGRGGPPFEARELRDELARFAEAPAVPALRAIAFSGDGEPTLSPHLGEALDLAGEARLRWPGAFAGARLLLITNSAGFLRAGVAETVGQAMDRWGLEAWVKLDAGSEARFRQVDRGRQSFEELLAGILRFARARPVTVQGMFCAIAAGALPGSPLLPPRPADFDEWLARVAGLLGEGATLDGLHLYTQSRSPAAGLSAALPDPVLAGFAALARDRLREFGSRAPAVRAFGERGEILPAGAST